MSSSDEAMVLQSIGHDLVQDFAAVTVETFLIAIYSVLALTATRMLLRKQRTRVSICTCLAVAALYVMAFSLWIIDVRNVIAEVRLTLLSNSNDTLDNLYTAALLDILRLSSVEDVLYAYMTNIGDAIIIWRVYAFWSSQKERLVLLIPLLFLLGSISTSATLSFCAGRLGADIVLGTYQHPAFCRNIQTASYSTTLATTAVATILISYKTWAYRQSHLAAFGKSNPRTRTLKVMIGLIESGVIYMLFFVVQVVMSLDSVNTKIAANAGLTFAFTIYQYITSLIVGIYPTIVVILVHSSYSVLDSRVGSSSRVLVSTPFTSRMASEGGITHSNTSTAALSDPGRAQKTEINLYEMSRRSTNGEDDKDGRLKVAPPAVTYTT